MFYYSVLIILSFFLLLTVIINCMNLLRALFDLSDTELFVIFLFERHIDGNIWCYGSEVLDLVIKLAFIELVVVFVGASSILFAFFFFNCLKLGYLLIGSYLRILCIGFRVGDRLIIASLLLYHRLL